jgi:excisionase family DNA binding protein
LDGSQLHGNGKALRMAGLFLYAHERWIMDYISIAEAAEKWNITRRRVQVLCNEGRIPGLTRFGKAWAIPRDAVKPADARKKLKAFEQNKKLRVC